MITKNGNADHTIVFMILAHSNPAALKELVKALHSKNVEIVIHVDAKADIDTFKAAAPLAHFVEERVAVTWGRWSQVQADLAMMNLSLEVLDNRPGHICLISGDSYPLVEISEIREYFSNRPQHQFYNVAPMPAPHLHKPKAHLSHRFLVDYDHRNGKKNLIAKVANNLIPVNYKKALRGISPMCGSAWWALSAEAATWITSFTEENKDLVKYFQKIRCPDEKYFQTLLCFSPYSEPRLGSPMYSDFDRVSGPSPALVDRTFIDNILRWTSIEQEHPGYGASVRLFARKFGPYRPELYEDFRNLLWPKLRESLPPLPRRDEAHDNAN